MRKLDFLIDKSVGALMWVACFVGFLMMMHITLDVTGRVLFNSPFVGTIEIVSAYYMVAVAYLPLAYVSRGDGQIIVELFTRNMRPRRILRTDAVVHLITSLYMLMFASFTALHAVEQTVLGEIGEMGDEFFPIWPSRWLLPIGFAVMAFYLIMRGLRDYRNSARDE